MADHDQVKAWLNAGITAVKVQRLLARRGVVVPRRTVQRYAAEVCDAGRKPQSTVRVADGKPGDECQVDFGRLGLVFDSVTGRRRVCHALVFTACVSRHCFVWLSFTQTTAAGIMAPDVQPGSSGPDRKNMRAPVGLFPPLIAAVSWMAPPTTQVDAEVVIVGTAHRRLHPYGRASVPRP